MSGRRDKKKVSIFVLIFILLVILVLGAFAGRHFNQKKKATNILKTYKFSSGDNLDMYWQATLKLNKDGVGDTYQETATKLLNFSVSVKKINDRNLTLAETMQSVKALDLASKKVGGDEENWIKACESAVYYYKAWPEDFFEAVTNTILVFEIQDVDHYLALFPEALKTLSDNPEINMRESTIAIALMMK